MRVIEEAKQRIAEYYRPLEAVVLANQEKVLRAFHAAQVASHCFADSTGYAYSDQGGKPWKRSISRCSAPKPRSVVPKSPQAPMPFLSAYLS